MKDALIVIVIAVAVVGFGVFVEKTVTTNFTWFADMDFSDEENQFADPECTIAGVMVHGDIYTYYDWESQSVDDVVSSEGVMYDLGNAEYAKNIKAIILEIDSYGGQPVAAEEIVDAIKKDVSKPVVAVIRGAGLSAGYWIASATDYVFASALSDVGSIGVTQSYVGQTSSVQEDGEMYYQLTTGKYKDAGSPDKPLTDDERALFERDLAIVHDIFVKSVAENRGMKVEEVAALADGSWMLGQQALEKGLIDAIGSVREAENYIATELGIDPVTCW